MVWRGISLEGYIDPCRLDNGPMTAFRCWDGILGPLTEPTLVHVALGSSWCRQWPNLCG